MSFKILCCVRDDTPCSSHYKDSLDSGPICGVDSTSERVPANAFLSSPALDSYAIGSRLLAASQAAWVNAG